MGMFQVLEEMSQDQEAKQRLLTGRRVLLAEELKKVLAFNFRYFLLQLFLDQVRQIQERLEDFIKALNEGNHEWVAASWGEQSTFIEVEYSQYYLLRMGLIISDGNILQCWILIVTKACCEGLHLFRTFEV